jgi:hypothetical protein
MLRVSISAPLYHDKNEKQEEGGTSIPAIAGVTATPSHWEWDFATVRRSATYLLTSVFYPTQGNAK